ncbi:serine hydrolase domain-containing protein [Chitinophaga sp. 212800010-3]|uniref:serine hydrolase domain-containing protein n=1 Tax=unclassified Chitinophaga TaxID=2619133 RepID=UPI002E0D67E7
MKLIYFIFAGTILSVSAHAQSLSTRIDNYLHVDPKGHPFNGTALVAYKGNILLYKGYGYMKIDNRKPADTSTIYRIGSLSKPFTSTVIMRLSQDGKLRLRDNLSTYLPGYPKGDSITIENLLTHSSGIKDYLEVKSVQQLPDSAPPVSMDRLISYFKDEPLGDKPGKKFAYSNSNYILLAAIAEKVTGKKFEQVVREMIFTPLQMDHSGFDFLHLADRDKSTGYTLDNKQPSPVIDFDSTYAPGCGSAFTTAMDLYKFYRGLCANQLIDSPRRALAFTPHQWLYGYGWFSYSLYGRKCISHAGGVPGFLSNLQFYPDIDLCIVLLSNMSEGDLVERADKIASLVFQLPYQSSGL